MIYVFTASITGKTYWYQNLSDLPIIEGADIRYHIYPVYTIGGKIYNLLREKIILSDGEFTSPYFHLFKYLKEENKNLSSLFISGIGESTNVFENEEAYIEYNIVTKACYRVIL